MTVYDYEVKDSEGNSVSLNDFEGKILLIVNSATKCGFTPQYTELNEIFKGLSGKGATKLKLAIKAMRMNYEENDIRWNFTKFLVDRKGNPVRRFEPTEDLGDVKDAIKELL